MTIRTGIIVVGLATGAAMSNGTAQQGTGANQPAQTFRTSTDLVLVDVAVRDGGRPVTGLRAEDFVLTDNGVRQRIDSAEAASFPIDLSLVLDVSGRPGGSWRDYEPPSKVNGAIQAEVATVGKLLRPEDRIRVLAIDRYVQLLAPLSAPAVVGTSFQPEFDGLPALYDALAAALLMQVEPARRHVVIAGTKGLDSISSIEARSLQSIAEQSDALFHLVMMETAADNSDALRRFQCKMMGYCWPTRRFWVPFQRRLVLGPAHALTPDGLLAAAAAEATGGRLHRAGLSVPSVASTLKKTLDDFRSSYVLRYTPQGVTRAGWHTIAVKLTRGRKYAINARRGYGVEEAPAAGPVPSKVTVPRTLAEITSVYGRGMFAEATAAIRQLRDPLRTLREFEAAGNPWPSTPRREAAFVLELADAGVFSSRADAREQADKLLDRFTRLVRHPLEPDPFERYWYFGALTLLEGTIRPAVTQVFVDRALERFPSEPRFVLSRAIVADQRWMTRGQLRDSAISSAAGPDAADVRRNYETAVAMPDIAIEARVRLAAFLHRSGLHQDAHDHLRAAGAQPIADPYLGYLRQLFLGNVLDALGRRADAIDAYRGAAAIVPAAQSARVAMMNALLLQGDRAAAETLAEQIQTETATGTDPWWIYWQGQYRFHSAVMTRLREMSK